MSLLQSMRMLCLIPVSGLRYLRRLAMRTVARGYLRAKGVRLGTHLDIVSLPFVRKHRTSSIEIGDYVTIRNKTAENPAGATHRCVLVTGPQARLYIGKHVGVSGAVVYCTTEIVIEDHVNIGVGVKIYDTDFHPIDARARRAGDKTQIRSAPVRIGADAWIGAEALILKGVTIGKRAIVGARAVVTKDVPDDCVVAGVPARVVRRLKDPDRITVA